MATCQGDLPISVAGNCPCRQLSKPENGLLAQLSRLSKSSAGQELVGKIIQAVKPLNFTFPNNPSFFDSKVNWKIYRLGFSVSKKNILTKFSFIETFQATIHFDGWNTVFWVTLTLGCLALGRLVVAYWARVSACFTTPICPSCPLFPLTLGKLFKRGPVPPVEQTDQPSDPVPAHCSTPNPSPIRAREHGEGQSHLASE